MQSTLTALISSTPAAAGMWKGDTKEKEEQVVKKNLLVLLELPEKFNLLFQEMGTTSIVWHCMLKSFFFFFLTLCSPRLKCWQFEWTVWNGCVADRLYRLTTHCQRVYDGTLCGAALQKLPHCCVARWAFRGGLRALTSLPVGVPHKHSIVCENVHGLRGICTSGSCY